MNKIAEIIVDVITLGITRWRRIKREEARKAADEKAERIKELTAQIKCRDGNTKRCKASD